MMKRAILILVSVCLVIWFSEEGLMAHSLGGPEYCVKQEDDIYPRFYEERVLVYYEGCLCIAMTKSPEYCEKQEDNINQKLSREYGIRKELIPKICHFKSYSEYVETRSYLEYVETMKGKNRFFNEIRRLMSIYFACTGRRDYWSMNDWKECISDKDKPFDYHVGLFRKSFEEKKVNVRGWRSYWQFISLKDKNRDQSFLSL